MSDLWRRTDPVQRVNVVKNSLILEHFRNAARDNHLAMRRRYDLDRLVWDFGERTQPGCYGTIELDTRTGDLKYVDLFGMQGSGLEFLREWPEEELGIFFHGCLEQAHTIPITVVNTDNIMLLSSPDDMIQAEPHYEPIKFMTNPISGEIDLVLRPPSKPMQVEQPLLPERKSDPHWDELVRIHKDGPAHRTPKKFAHTLVFSLASGFFLCFIATVMAFGMHQTIAGILLGCIAFGLAVWTLAVLAWHDESQRIAHGINETDPKGDLEAPGDRQYDHNE
jgi:hypothetical protein